MQVLYVRTWTNSYLLQCVRQVHVVELKLSREEAARRHQAAAAAAAAGLEVADLGAEASQGLLGEASFMPQQQQVLAEEQVRWCSKVTTGLLTWHFSWSRTTSAPWNFRMFGNRIPWVSTCVGC